VSLPEDENTEIESNPALPQQRTKGEVFTVATADVETRPEDANNSFGSTFVTRPKEAEAVHADVENENGGQTASTAGSDKTSFESCPEIATNAPVDQLMCEAAEPAAPLFNFSVDLDSIDLSLSPTDKAETSQTASDSARIDTRRISSDTYVKSSPSLANLIDVSPSVAYVGENVASKAPSCPDVVNENEVLDVSGVTPIVDQPTVVRALNVADLVLDDSLDEASILIANQLRLSRGEKSVGEPRTNVVEARAQCYKTFYGCNLRIFVIS
jgi:hypothetical protein